MENCRLFKMYEGYRIEFDIYKDREVWSIFDPEGCKIAYRSTMFEAERYIDNKFKEPKPRFEKIKVLRLSTYKDDLKDWETITEGTITSIVEGNQYCWIVWNNKNKTKEKESTYSIIKDTEANRKILTDKIILFKQLEHLNNQIDEMSTKLEHVKI